MAIEDIIAVCNARKIKYEHHLERELLTVQVPKARSFTNILLTEELSSFAIDRDIDFLSYRLIDGYEAIWSQTHDCIECEIELPHRNFPFERIFRNNQQAIDDGKLLIPTHIIGVQVELSSVSDEFHFIDLYKDLGRPRYRMSLERFDQRKTYSTSLKVTGLNVTSHDQALNIIKTIFASICFQIDCKTDLPVMLATEKNFTRVNSSTNSMEVLDLATVNQKYDSEALSLYWYAQSALGMPLLQYLALYQVVEFYYPIYSELTAQKKVANTLKDPCFNSHSEKDVAKIFNIVKASTSARSELSQLESTIKECIDASDFRDWLMSDSKREEYFRSKNAVKLSEYKVNSNADSDDLLRQVWQRFYNIRCRIVHTKGAEGDLDVLHPQSREVKYLSYDIELANYVAHKVLIASSKPIEAV